MAEVAQNLPSENKLDGAQKAAIVLLALGKERAAQLIRHFSPEDVERITEHADRLGAISESDLEALVEEFAGAFSTGVNFLGSSLEMQNLLSNTTQPELGDGSDGEDTEDAGPPKPLWEQLGDLKPAQLKAYLDGEHPQARAMILAHLDPPVAASVLKLMDVEERNGVVRRLVGFNSVPDAVRHVVETVLHKQLLAKSTAKAEGVARQRVAGILNQLDKSDIDDIFSNIAEQRPQDAKALKSLLFSFEDVVKLTEADRQILFNQVAAEQLVLALNGTDAEFKNTVLSVLAARARRMVETELENADGVAERDIATARRAVADLAISLSAQGDIKLDSEGDVNEEDDDNND